LSPLFFSWVIFINKYLHKSNQLTSVKNVIVKAVRRLDPQADVRAVVHWNRGLPHVHVAIWAEAGTALTRSGAGATLTEYLLDRATVPVRAMEVWDQSRMGPELWVNYVTKANRATRPWEVPPAGKFKFAYGFKRERG
jgi:hypothetical protein